MRRILVEAAWAYRHPPRFGRVKQARVAAAPKSVRETAWKAQVRSCGRYRSLSRKGKHPCIVAAAIASELSALIGAINRESWHAARLNVAGAGPLEFAALNRDLQPLRYIPNGSNEAAKD